MKRILFIACIFATFAPFVHLDTAAQSMSGQVLLGDDLVARGVYRLGDIGPLLHRGRSSSVDGFASNYSIGGLSPLQHSAYKLQVDGHNLETGFWDFRNLTSLGIPLTDVDSIRITHHPVMAGGVIAAGGLIEIYTKKYEERITTSISTFAGNESGDPGPFRYSEEDVVIANVDKIGPDAAAAFTMRDQDVVFSAGLAVSQLIPSDEAVFLRNRRIFDVSITPEVRMVSPHMRFSWNGTRFSSDARVFGLSDRDMMFSSAIAREIPVDIKQIQASWIGSAAIGNDRELNVNTSFRAVDVSNLASSTRIPVRWNETNVRMNIVMRNARAGSFVKEYGSSMNLDRASSFTSSRVSDQHEVRLFMTSGFDIASVYISTDVFAGTHNGRFTGGILASGSYAYRQSIVTGNASLLRLSRISSDPLGAWLGSGLQVSTDIPSQSVFGRTYGIYTADASWTWLPSKTDFRVSLAPSMRYFHDADLHARTVTGDGPGFVSTSNRSQRSDGTIAGIHMSVAHENSLLRNVLSVDAQHPIQGDMYFRRSMSEVPSTKVLVESSVIPSKSFRAIASAVYLSSAQWYDYSFLDEDEEGLYSSIVEPAFRIDAGIAKTFWSGRVTTQVTLENIFNDHISYHPIGARFDRTMKLTAHIKLD